MPLRGRARRPSRRLGSEPLRAAHRRDPDRRALTGGAATTRDNEGMVDGPEEAVAFRLWPPVAIGVPLLVGWLATLLWGDPVDLGRWRVALGWVLVLLFVGWNGWSLWLFGRRGTGAAAGAGDARDDRGGAVPALPQPVVRRPARALPRAGVAGAHVLGARAGPGRGAARPLGRDPSRGAVPARAVRCAVRRLHPAGASLALTGPGRAAGRCARAS